MGDFLNVVFRWKYLILAVVLLTTSLIVFLRVSKPVTYVSGSRVLVQRGKRSTVYIADPRYFAWAEEMSSQLEVVLSEAVFSGARKLFADSLAARGLQGTRTFSAGAVRADVVGESNVIAINYASLDPLESEFGCAAVTQSYLTYYEKETAPPPVDDFFNSEIDNALGELTQWRQQKSEFLQREDWAGAQQEGTREMYTLSRLEASVADVESDMSAQKMRVDKLKIFVNLPADELDQRLSATTTDSPVQGRALGEIRLDLQKLRSKREELLTRYTERHPDVMSVDNQIQDLKNQLNQEVQNAYELAVSEYDELSAKYQTLMREVGKTQAEIALLPDKEKQLARIESNITAYEDKYRLLLTKQHEAQIAVATSSEFKVAVLTPPGKATARRTSDYVRLAVGPFLSLIVGLGLAFFFESMDHTVKNAAEVEQYLGTTVLATVSEARQKD